ncbi:hypothetical protein [Thermocrinis sp.]
MNRNLIEAIKAYSTKDFKELHRILSEFSKPTLISILIDLLTIYFNDKNSSKLRELVTLWLCGWEPNMEKLGYNGYRMVFPLGIKEWCEVKPQNTDSVKRKLNGGGSFNDYTWERFKKDLENNPTILSSGFVQGKIVFIFEFRFKCLKEKLENVLNERFKSGRGRGEYLRSAQFSFTDYKNCDSFRLAFLREDWINYKGYLSNELRKYFETWKA